MTKLCPFRKANIFNVQTDYALWEGSACHADDSTDDVAHIQAAIDYVTSIGGGTVYLPAGTYRVTATNALDTNSTPSDVLAHLELKDNVTIMGAGQGATILHGATNNAHPIAAAQQRNVGVRDLTVYHAGSGSDGVKIYACSGVTAYRVTTHGGYIGIAPHGSNNVLIDQCTVYDCAGVGITCGQNAVGCNNPDGVWGGNCIVRDCEVYGMTGTYATAFRANGQALNAVWDGQSITRREPNVQFIRCNAHDNTGNSFGLLYAQNISMEDCLSNDCTEWHMIVMGVDTLTCSGYEESGTGTTYKILIRTGSGAHYYANTTNYDTYYGPSNDITVNGTEYLGS